MIDTGEKAREKRLLLSNNVRIINNGTLFGFGFKSISATLPYISYPTLSFVSLCFASSSSVFLIFLADAKPLQTKDPNGRVIADPTLSKEINCVAR